MAGKGKNIRTSLSGFLRYMEKKISNRERNAFERELQKDPFAGEAAEGFESISAEKAKMDLLNLQKRLKSRSVNKTRFIWYRIAASLVILIGITSLFIINQRNKPEKLISENTGKEMQFEILKPSIVAEPSEKEDTKIALNDTKSEVRKSKPASPVSVKSDTISILADEKFELMEVTSEVNENIIAPAKKEAETRALAEEKPAAMAKAVYDKNISAGAVSSVRSEDLKQLTGYSPPEPVSGKDNFDKYIEENIHRPSNSKAGEMIVLVRFKVYSSGIRDSIRIIRSPGKAFSDEAIRLIKEGPEWKPAERNSIKIDDEVRLRIIFK